IDYDNAEDFDFSGAVGAYGQLVAANFSKKVSEEYEKEMGKDASFDNTKYSVIQLEIFKTIKSKNIKNALARDVAYGINPANEQSETIYKELMASVTDDS